jgi:hypothetical protein
MYIAAQASMSNTRRRVIAVWPLVEAWSPPAS